VGDSPSMRQLFRQMDRVAASEITVLIHGESGTGKELVARAIHEASGRARGPYVTLNCAAIAESLQESELFGHEKGSFTGAEQRRIGRFEQADGGTLFLDEVAELSPALQAKLLRVLQERRFQRVGGTTEIQSDFRLIAATHRNLGDEVRAGRFREDLFFRIAVLELEIPPLRDRGDDVLLLSRSFLREISQQERGGAPITLAPSARSALLRYDWPGNVRELQNALHRGYVLSGGDTIRARDLPERILAGGYEESPSAELPSVPDRPVGLLRGGPAAPLNGAGMGHGAPSAAAGAGVSSLDEVEREAIRLALERCHWNLSEAGRQLGIGRTTLYRKIKKYGLR
jgi:DNA-binding NtrC family response regulator